MKDCENPDKVRIRIFTNAGPGGSVDYYYVEKFLWESFSKEEKEAMLDRLACDLHYNYSDFGAYVEPNEGSENWTY